MATCSSSEDSPVNILLIGQTGVGKTSLANLFYNYAHHKKNFNVEEDIEQFIKPRSRRHMMEGDTTNVTGYSMEVNGLKVLLMDTPGILDMKNFASQVQIDPIIQKIRSLDYLNCICLVLNGTVAVAIPEIDLVIKEILKFLPSEVLNNVIVIFTNTKDTLSLNFDLDSLKSYGLDIQSEQSFMIENPFSRWHKAKGMGIVKGESESLTTAFSDSYVILDKILAKAKKFDPVATKKFGKLHKIIQAIEQDIDSISLELTSQLLHKKIAVDARKYQQAQQKLNELEKGDYTYKTEYENIVCMECSNNCHDHCPCIFTGKRFGNIRACRKFRRGICQECKHSSDDHEKVKYLFKSKPKSANNEEESTEEEQPINEEKRVKQSNIEEKKQKLFQDLNEFQIIGSNSFLIKVSSKEVKRLQSLIQKLTGFEEEQRKAIKMLDETIQVGTDPFSDHASKNMQLKWACGMLGVDPYNLQRDDINAAFQKIATRQNKEQYRYYEHAKNVLDSELSNSFLHSLSCIP